MGEKLYPDQVSRDRYLSDLNAVRQDLQNFSAVCAQINEMNQAIKREESDMENPDFLQKLLALKWFILALIVVYPLSNYFINITMSPEGKPATWAIAFGVAGWVLVGVIIYLWTHPAKVYSKTESYRQRLEALEQKRAQVNKVGVKKSEYESRIVQKLYYVPSKYCYDATFYKLEDYMRHNGATNLAEAINMLEASRR